MKDFILPCAAAAVLFASASPAAPAGSNMPSANAETVLTGQSLPGLQIPLRTDIAPFQKAKLSLADAIHAAQQQHSGKTAAAWFEVWDGQPAYFVRTCFNDQIWEGRINAITGQLIGQPQTFTLNQVTRALREEAKAVRNIHTSLAQAINDAEQGQRGKAIMAGVEIGANGDPDYDVDTVKSGRFHAALVDAKTGQVA